MPIHLDVCYRASEDKVAVMLKRAGAGIDSHFELHVSTGHDVAVKGGFGIPGIVSPIVIVKRYSQAPYFVRVEAVARRVEYSLPAPAR